MPIQLVLGVVLLAAGGVLALRLGRPDHRAGAALQRGRVARNEARLVAVPVAAATGPVTDRLAPISRRVAPQSMVDDLERRVARAGMQGKWSTDQLLVVKLALGAVGALLMGARFASAPSVLNAVMGCAFLFAAWYLPDILIGRRGDERRLQIQQALPDTMDQLTIAVEAGLGFEAALNRVAKEGEGPLAEELLRTVQDIQLGMDRSQALEGLELRTDVADVKRFVAAARQAERHGLPIATVLRVQAAELRDKRRQRAEEHAMKIPVKVLFPLLLCILPTLFVVILGPGVIRALDSGLGS